MSNACHLTVENLRKNGYKVRVCHTRDFWPLVDLAGESIMTRREYEQCLSNGSIFGSPHCEQETYDYGDVVQPTGGFTLVEVTKPDGETIRGKCNFSVHKQYNKREGVKIALFKAFRGNVPQELVG